MNKVFFAQNVSQCHLEYGLLYNWYAASCYRFAPDGWTVPECADYTTLKTYLGGYQVAGGHLKETGTTYWCSPNTDADNSSGFAAWGVGERLCTGLYADLYCDTYIWGRDVCGGATSFRSLRLAHDCAWAFAAETQDSAGQSIRLLYTGASTPSGVTDYDGNYYNAVVIGTQRWTIQNWKSTRYDDGTSIPKVLDNETWSGCTSGAYSYYDNKCCYI